MCPTSLLEVYYPCQALFISSQTAALTHLTFHCAPPPHPLKFNGHRTHICSLVCGASASAQQFGVSAPVSHAQSPTTHFGPVLPSLQVPTRGLLNIVAAPHLGESSTYRALYVHKEDDTADCTLAAHLAGKGCGGGSGSSSSTESNNSGDDIAHEVVLVAADTQSHGSSAAATSGSKRLRSGDASSLPADTPAGQLGRAGASSKDVKHISDTGMAGGKHGQQQQHHQRQQAANQTVQVQNTKARGRETLANDLSVVQTTALLASLGFEPKVSGHWHSGLPRLDLAVKDSAEAWKAGIQLPLVQLDVSALKVREKTAWFE